MIKQLFILVLTIAILTLYFVICPTLHATLPKEFDLEKPDYTTRRDFN